MHLSLIVFLLNSILFSQIIESSKNSPLNVLSSKILKNKIIKLDDKKLEFNPGWVDSLKLVLPCENVKVPKRAMRLPNAPRDYRNGVHKGIDFFANWGTPVRAVAEGIVIRSDLFYEEVPAEYSAGTSS